MQSYGICDRQESWRFRLREFSKRRRRVTEGPRKARFDLCLLGYMHGRRLELVGCLSERLAGRPVTPTYPGEDGPWGSYPLPLLNVNVSKRSGCVGFTLHFSVPWKRMQIQLECRLFSNVPERVGWWWWPGVI